MTSNSGKRVWRDLYSNSMNWGSVLTTAGGLLFAGGTNDRMFRAYDAKTGEELWHFRTNSGIIAPPSTFEVNGVQYVAVAVRLRRRPRVPAGLMSRPGRLEPGRAAGRSRLGVRRSSERLSSSPLSLVALAAGSMAASLLVVLLKRSFPMPFVQYARTNSILARLHAFALSITNRAGLAEGLSYIPDR